MKQSKHFLENAENCAQLAERATDEPTHNRYKRMEAAWRAKLRRYLCCDREL
jgi:hypothetical protein